ncbi:MAG: hypothetical protein LBE01_05525 [Deltaproteobacteria bacterium]|jgi:hypothetical protein|nr:hypothetical protein [Deltaproteobacteria bacterium]
MSNFIIVLKLFGGIDEIGERRQRGDKRRRPLGLAFERELSPQLVDERMGYEDQRHMPKASQAKRLSHRDPGPSIPYIP